MFDTVEAFYRPASVPEALRLLQRGKGKARIVAGGTDVVVAGGESVRVLIDITRAGLSYIRRKGTALAIGATTTLAEVEESGDLRTFAGGLLPRVAATCGSVSIRNLATLGGNLANASPAADMAVSLAALDAAVTLADARGRHKLPLAEYLAGACNNGFSKSILVEVVIPEPPAGKSRGWSFQKLGRTAVDISLVSVAAGLQLDSRHCVKWARIALGSVAPTVMRAETAERQMIGRTLDDALIAQAAAEVARAVTPVSDLRASADYRREISGVLVARALRECAARVGGLP
ncbi:MAG: FAD binding domain-containing protein [Bryobacteraceae bacterium]